MLERFWESKEKLIEKQKTLESEIASLREKINDINAKKEQWFAKKEELKKQLQESIKQIKDVKIKKDSLSVDIQKLKKERNEYNKIVGELISKVKLLNKERETLYAKSNLKINPGSIREKIDALETKIETEAISFGQEQKLMKQIKNLKSQYNEMNGVVKLGEHIRQLSNEINTTRNKAQDLHRKIQDYAKQDEVEYIEFIDGSKNLNSLRQEQESAFKKFVMLKRLFIEMNNQLKVKLEEAARIKSKIQKTNAEKTLKTKDEEIAMLKDKLKYVEEKLRKGEKLTTEDILLFQKGTENT